MTQHLCGPEVREDSCTSLWCLLLSLLWSLAGQPPPPLPSPFLAEAVSCPPAVLPSPLQAALGARRCCRWCAWHSSSQSEQPNGAQARETRESDLPGKRFQGSTLAAFPALHLLLWKARGGQGRSTATSSGQEGVLGS